MVRILNAFTSVPCLTSEKARLVRQPCHHLCLDGMSRRQQSIILSSTSASAMFQWRKLHNYELYCYPYLLPHGGMETPVQMTRLSTISFLSDHPKVGFATFVDASTVPRRLPCVACTNTSVIIQTRSLHYNSTVSDVICTYITSTYYYSIYSAIYGMYLSEFSILIMDIYTLSA